MSFISSYQKLLKGHENFTKEVSLITQEEQQNFIEKIKSLHKVKELSYRSFSEQKSRQELFSLVGSSLSLLQAAVFLSLSHQMGIDSWQGKALGLSAIADLIHQTVKNSSGWGAFYALYDPNAPQEIKESIGQKIETSLNVFFTISKLYHGLDIATSLRTSSLPDLIDRAKEILTASLPIVKGAHEIASSITSYQLETIRQELTKIDQELRMTRMNEKEGLELLKKALDETSQVLSLFTQLSDQIASTTL